MKLIKLELENFKGIKSASFDFSGKSCAIRGANGTGKSTIADAFSWILTDKPMSGVKGFNPQTVDDDGKPIHKMDHSVKVIISLDDSVVTLKKTLAEKWTKKRGSVSEEFSGRVTSYEIDGVPKKKKEFDAYLASILDADKFQVLSNIRYFAESMSWQDRRAIVMDICGDVTDDDVIDSNKDIKDLKKAGMAISDLKEVAKNEMKKCNKRLEEIPARIDESRRALPETTIDAAEETKRIEEATAEIDEAKARIASLESLNTAYDEKMAKIAEIKSDIAQEKSRYVKNVSELQDSYYKKEVTLKRDIESAESDVKKNKRLADEASDTITSDEHALRSFQKSYEEYKKMLSEEKARVFTDDKCPYCGQTLPADMLDNMREEFNTKQSKKLADITNDMETIDKKATAKHDEYVLAKQEFSELEAAAITLENVLIEKKEALDAFEKTKPDFPSFEETDTFKSLNSKLEEAMMMSVEDTSSKEVEKEKYRIAGLESVIETSRKKIAEYQASERTEARIAELESELELVRNHYAKNEKILWMCDEFTKTKVAMITDRINTIFKNVTFRLFETQVNGGIKECCDVMIPVNGALVQWGDANTASKVNAGVEIIDQLSKYYKESVPLFIDNAEGVTHIKAPDTIQLIRLIVDDKCKKLKLED